MLYKQLFAIFGLFFLFAQTTQAQPPAHWRYWVAEDGLAESCCNTVYCGPSGKVWINHGHINSMSCFDGYTMYHLPSPGIGVPVYETTSGSLWSIYRLGFKQLINPLPKTSGQWIRHKVAGIQTSNTPFFPIDDEHILYLTPNRLMIYHPSKGESTTFISIENTSLTAFLEIQPSKNRGVWISGINRLAKLEQIQYGYSDKFVWTEYPFDEQNERFRFDTLIATEEDSLYITAHSLYSGHTLLLHFDGQDYEIVYQSQDPFQRGWQTHDQRTWLFEEPFSLRCLEPSGLIIPIPKNKVLSRVLLDVDMPDTRSFWLATSEGLARYAPAAWQKPAEIADQETVVHDMVEDASRNVWFAYADALVCHDLQTNKWNRYPLPENQRSDELKADSLAILPNNNMVLKTTQTSYIFDTQTRQFAPLRHPSNHSISCFSSQQNGRLLTISHTNVFTYIHEFDGSQFRQLYGFRTNRFIDWNVRDLIKDYEGNLWFGGLNGIVRYRDDEFRTYDKEDGFIETAVNCMHLLPNRRLWIGGRDAILEFNGTRWKTVQTGLDGVRTIMSSINGSIWVASGTGLHRYSQGSWVTIQKDEGLPDAAVYTVFEDSHNNLWVGTTSGMALYYPQADTETPETHIPANINSNTFPIGSGQFYVEGVDKWNYSPAERLLYSFRIDGKTWSPFQPNTIIKVPQNLSSGDHTLEIKTMDRNWNIDPAPAKIAFQLILPWYRHPMVLSITGVLILILSLSISIHISHHQNLENLVRRRTEDLSNANKKLQKDAVDLKEAYERVLAYQKELQKLTTVLSQVEENERRQIATDLHDTIGQLLSLSMIKLEALESSLNESTPSHQIQELKDLIEKTLNTSRNLMYDLYPPTLYELGFEAAVKQLVERFINQNDLYIAMNIDNKPKPLDENMQYFLFRATRELLMNVVKHAQTSQVQLEIKRENNQIQIDVIDDGKGFDANTSFPGVNANSSFGLFSIRERLARMGGNITINSVPGQGTHVTLVAPLSCEKEDKETSV